MAETTVIEQVPEGHEQRIISGLCKLCGQPMQVRVDADTNDDAISAWLPQLTHAKCLDKRYELEQGAKRVEAAIYRQQWWEGICPYEFRKPIDFKAKGSRQENLNLLLAWKFGERGILAHGYSGLCKTRFMFQLLKREFDAEHTVAYYNIAEMRSRAIQLMRDDGGSQMIKWVKWLAGVDILFIDDLGKAKFSDGFEEMFYVLIENRSKHCRPTFFTTNLSRAGLEAAMSDDRSAPILRRIYDTCDLMAFK